VVKCERQPAGDRNAAERFDAARTRHALPDAVSYRRSSHRAGGGSRGSNEASENGASVSGGTNNLASGFGASVSGGASRTAGNEDDWVAGALLEDF